MHVDMYLYKIWSKKFILVFQNLKNPVRRGILDNGERKSCVFARKMYSALGRQYD